MKPRLAAHVRLRQQPATGRWLLVLPEAVVELNETAAAVLALCDGDRELATIVTMLAETYDEVSADDVQALLDQLATDRLVDLP